MLMKHSFILCLLTLLLCVSASTKAQTYVMINDTISYNISTPSHSYDSIVIGSSSVTFKWKIIDCNFPADWVVFTDSAAIFCDNQDCRLLSSLWPSVDTNETEPYASADSGVLELVLNLPATATPGCYYVTARLYNTAVASDSAKETWYVCKAPKITGIINSAVSRGLVLYPDPANNELNIVGADANKVIIIDVTGKVIAEQAFINGNAVIDLHGFRHGVYFARFIDSFGVVNATRKFVKE